MSNKNCQYEMFIGSSSCEVVLKVTHVIQSALKESCVFKLWNYEESKLRQDALISFVASLADCDFATFVLPPDNAASSQRKKKQVPIYDFLFELGLSIGRLGPERIFVIYHEDMPIDYVGKLGALVMAHPYAHKSGNLAASMKPLMNAIKACIHNEGALKGSVSLVPRSSAHEPLCNANFAVSKANANAIGKSVLANDSSNLFFTLLSVLDCGKSRMHVTALTGETEFSKSIALEAAYDLLGAWDLLVRFRADSIELAEKFHKGIVSTLIKGRMMDNSPLATFGKNKLVNIRKHSKSVRGLLDPSQGEQISYCLLPNGEDYDKFRANRSFILIQTKDGRSLDRREQFLKELAKSVEADLGNKIVEAICEGESEWILETFSTCAQSNLINLLNRQIEDVLTTYDLQKATLVTYFLDESKMLEDANGIVVT